MMHFFRKPAIHLDAFTYRRDVIEYAPVVNGIEKIPDWWKALPKKLNTTFFPTATMKTCVGMYDYYNKSIAMPLWSDMAVSVDANKNYLWQFSDKITASTIHDKSQYSGFDLGSFGHIKILSPWLFKTKKNLDWLLTCPIYGMNAIENFFVAQGLLNFNKQHVTNIQLLINTNSPRVFHIPFNTTFLFTPLSDNKVVIHRHLISQEKYDSIRASSIPSTFINPYKTHGSLQKCPYKDKTK